MKHKAFICKLMAVIVSAFCLTPSLSVTAESIDWNSIGISQNRTYRSPFRSTTLSNGSTVNLDDYYEEDEYETPDYVPASNMRGAVEPVIENNANAAAATTVSGPTIELYSPSSYNLYTGNTFKISRNATNYSYIEWSSSDTSVATVDSSGYVTIKSAGKVTITAWAYGSGQSASDSVTFTTRYMETTTTTTSRRTTTTTISPPIIKLYGNYENLISNGARFQINYEASYYSRIEWSSSNESIATVDSSGYVTLANTSYYGPWDITITATAYGYDGITSVSDSVNLYVRPITTTTTTTTAMAIPDISLSSPSSSDLYVGNTFKMNYSTYNSSYGCNIQWSSSDTSIATVDSDGYVTVKDAGKVTITAKISNNYSSYNYNTDSVTFTTRYYETTTPTTTTTSTTVQPAYINLYSPSSSNLYVGNTFKINYSASDVYISWSSSDTSIATVDSDGYVTVKGAGTVTITADASGYYSSYDSDSVTFTTYYKNTTTTTSTSSKPVTTTTTISENQPKIIPDSLTMKPGDTSLVFVLNMPEGKTVNWTSDNTKVATVSDGKVTAAGEGTATIYAVCGNAIATCEVTVSSGSVVYGDVDGDGKVSINDAVKIMSFVGNSDKYYIVPKAQDAADVYSRGDGVNNMDAVAVQKYLAQIVSSLPESYL